MNNNHIENINESWTTKIVLYKCFYWCSEEVLIPQHWSPNLSICIILYALHEKYCNVDYKSFLHITYTKVREMCISIWSWIFWYQYKPYETSFSTYVFICEHHAVK